MTTKHTPATPLLISTLRNGYVLKVEGKPYTVIGSRKLRRCYFYILRDANGEKLAIRREQMLAGQSIGQISIES